MNYVAVVQNAGSQTLYVNGTAVASGSLSLNTAARTTAYRGGDGIANIAFSGYIQEARLYNTALTATQIAQDMNTASLPEPASLLAFGLFFALFASAGRVHSRA